MGKRLRAKHKKRQRDLASANKKGESPAPHKVAVLRSRTAKLKKAHRV